MMSSRTYEISVRGAVRAWIQAPRLRTRAAVLALVACLAGSGRPVTAQQTAPTGPESPSFAAVWPRLAASPLRPLAAGARVGLAPPAQRPPRDSLKNGAITGAIVGAVGVAALGAFICHLYQEEGGASCLPDALRGAAIGAAVGTGAGLAVDAALDRRDGVSVRVRVKF
jgi:hypothetical protein